MPLSLDNFIDIKEVGSGTSAAVFSATRKKGGQAVALKRTLITSQAARVAAHREYSLLEQFPHLHLVETRDSFEHTYPDGSTYHFTVLELALRDLSFLLGPKAPRDGSNFATLLRYCAELLLAIEHLHSFKITHRDIKLANCFLRVSGELILGDLGSSRVYGGDGSLTIVGSPSYMSPELLNGTISDPFAADMYALGCTMYQILTGLRPGDHPGPEAAAAFPAFMPAYFPADVVDTIRRCTSYDVRLRPTASQLLFTFRTLRNAADHYLYSKVSKARVRTNFGAETLACRNVFLQYLGRDTLSGSGSRLAYLRKATLALAGQLARHGFTLASIAAGAAAATKEFERAAIARVRAASRLEAERIAPRALAAEAAFVGRRLQDAVRAPASAPVPAPPPAPPAPRAAAMGLHATRRAAAAAAAAREGSAAAAAAATAAATAAAAAAQREQDSQVKAQRRVLRREERRLQAAAAAAAPPAAGELPLAAAAAAPARAGGGAPAPAPRTHATRGATRAAAAAAAGAAVAAAAPPRESSDAEPAGAGAGAGAPPAAPLSPADDTTAPRDATALQEALFAAFPALLSADSHAEVVKAMRQVGVALLADRPAAALDVWLAWVDRVAAARFAFLSGECIDDEAAHRHALSELPPRQCEATAAEMTDACVGRLASVCAGVRAAFQIADYRGDASDMQPGRVRAFLDAILAAWNGTHVVSEKAFAPRAEGGRRAFSVRFVGATDDGAAAGDAPAGEAAAGGAGGLQPELLVVAAEAEAATATAALPAAPVPHPPAHRRFVSAKLAGAAAAAAAAMDAGAGAAAVELLVPGGAYGPGDSVSLWCAVRGGPWGGAALVRDGAHLFPPPSLPPGEYAGVLRVERRGAGGGGGGVSWEPFPADRSEDNGFGGRNAVFAVL